jgi:hypothetical protein
MRRRWPTRIVQTELAFNPHKSSSRSPAVRFWGLLRSETASAFKPPGVNMRRMTRILNGSVVNYGLSA